jgi:hypothetical protein
MLRPIRAAKQKNDARDADDADRSRCADRRIRPVEAPIPNLDDHRGLTLRLRSPFRAGRPRDDRDAERQEGEPGNGRAGNPSLGSPLDPTYFPLIVH